MHDRDVKLGEDSRTGVEIPPVEECKNPLKEFEETID